MDINDLHPPDDYSHRFFIWHEWIQAHGPLTTENVFEYFTTSMFYDKQSNNQVLRMQTMHTGVPIVDEAGELRRFTGVEFSLVHSQPPTFFVIQKRERLSPDEVRPMAAYFIMNNRIYLAPDLYTLASNRLLTSVFALQKSLDILCKHRPEYTPRTGFAWPIIDTSMKDSLKITESQQESGQLTENDGDNADLLQEKHSDNPRRQQNIMLMMNAMQTTTIQSPILSAPATSSFLQHETVEPDTPATATVRSSVTPAPQEIQKGSSNNASQESSKKQVDVSKKKKKRASIAPPPAPT